MIITSNINNASHTFSGVRTRHNLKFIIYISKLLCRYTPKHRAVYRNYIRRLQQIRSVFLKNLMPQGSMNPCKSCKRFHKLQRMKSRFLRSVLHHRVRSRKLSSYKLISRRGRLFLRHRGRNIHVKRRKLMRFVHRYRRRSGQRGVMNRLFQSFGSGRFYGSRQKRFRTMIISHIIDSLRYLA